MLITVSPMEINDQIPMGYNEDAKCNGECVDATMLQQLIIRTPYQELLHTDTYLHTYAYPWTILGYSRSECAVPGEPLASWQPIHETKFNCGRAVSHTYLLSMLNN